MRFTGSAKMVRLLMLRSPTAVLRALAWLALGVLVGSLLSPRLQRTPVYPAGSSLRQPASEAIQRLEQEQAVLREGVEARRRTLAEMDRLAASRSTTLASIESELAHNRMLAGLVEVEGPGVVVTLADGGRALMGEETVESVIVHDYDVRDVINALFAAGAEGIAVNGERVVFGTSVYCVGSTVIVGDRRLSPPLSIAAIGAPDELERMVQQDPELAPLRARAADRSIRLEVETEASLLLPAYSGATGPRFARAGS